MKIGIIHLTDIHFTENTDLSKRITSLSRAILNDFIEVKNIYIIISGDITNSGKLEEYKKAEGFLSVVKQLIVNEKKDCQLKYILVPGNHDCDFSLDTQLRKNSLNNLNYPSIGSDNSVINLCLSVQEQFWKFYEKYNAVPTDKLYFKIIDHIDNYNIIFHCINTAWVSQLNETPGKIFFPVKNYDTINFSEKDLNIGVWHHPYNWFNPNTIENNKKEFEIFTETIAPLHFFGHEHEQTFYIQENKNAGIKINLLSGEILNDNKDKRSGFQTLVLDIINDSGILKRYKWKKDFYDSYKKENLLLYKNLFKQYKSNSTFIQKLEEIKIPLSLENKRDIKLSDIFVYPDLELLNKESRDLERYTNALRLIDEDYRHCIIDGESQIGKTSLLSKFYLELLENDIVPIFLQGKEIVDTDLESILKKSFVEQYLDENFEKYCQLESKKKALLIDDLQESVFNSTVLREILENAHSRFGKVIVMVDSVNSILPAMINELKDVHFFSIKPLGYKKRNELIEKYQLLKQNPLTINEDLFFDSVKTSFDNVQSIIR